MEARRHYNTRVGGLIMSDACEAAYARLVELDSEAWMQGPYYEEVQAATGLEILNPPSGQLLNTSLCSTTTGTFCL